jgi:lipopolysaccharide exporter
MQGIGRQMAKGAAWMVGLRLVDRSIGLVSTVILARLLTPQDFGLVAMAMAFIAIVEMLQAFGFDVALIQNQQASREHFDSAWALNILLAAMGAALLLAGAKPVAAFYQEPRVETILYVLAIGAFVQGFENIGIVAFRKELAFDKEFRFQLAKKLVGFAVVVTLAFMYRSYWALVLGALVGRSVGVALSYAVHPFRPRFRLAHTRSLVRFSKWLLINNALHVARQRAAAIYVGRFFGANALGQFSMSLEISTLPTTELSAPINRAVFPGYTKLAQDDVALRAGFLKVISLIVLITLPAALGIAVVATPVVSVLLGEKWEAAGPLIQILALYGLVSSLTSNFGYVFLARGKPRYVTLWAAATVALQIIFVVLGTHYFGLIGAATGLLVGEIIPVPFLALALNKILGTSARNWLGITWRPLLSTAAMVVVVEGWLLASATYLSMMPALAILVVAIVIGAIVYAGCCFALWSSAGKPDGPEKYLEERIVGLLNQRRT